MLFNFSEKLNGYCALLYSDSEKGKIHDILGERKNAVKYYRDCIQLDNYSYAIKEAEQYINNPFRK